MEVPKCAAVEEATKSLMDLSERQQVLLEPVKFFLQDDECPFEIVPNDHTAVAVYKQFEDQWKDEFQVKYGNIPAATQFKAQITAIDGIHYLAGQNNRRTGPWSGQKNPYVGVRLKTQPAVAPAVAAAAAAAARAGGQ